MPSPSPSPSATPGAGLPTRVTGSPSLTMVFRDSINGVEEVSDASSVQPITYREGSFLWGEVVTQIGNNTFRINRDAPDPSDPAQRLPSYLRLNVEYSDALRKAISEEHKGTEGFDPSTGAFWVGELRCGSAISAASSPYQVTVQLLQDGREIARRQYVIGVQSNPPECVGESEPGGPPTIRE